MVAQMDTVPLACWEAAYIPVAVYDDAGLIEGIDT